MAQEKSFAVIGLGQFGLAVTKALINLNQQVIGIDRDETRVKLLENDIASVFSADCTNQKSLREVGVHKVDVAIVTFGDNLHDAIITTALLAEMKIKQIIVRLDNPEYESILKRLGATEIIGPTEIAGRSLAFKLAGTNFTDYFSFDQHYSVSSYTIPEGFKSRKLMDLDWRNQFNINIVLIKKTKGETDPKKVKQIVPQIPKAQEMVEALDILYVIGKNEELVHFSNALKK
jgi:trk system potassium uptake protein